MVNRSCAFLEDGARALIGHALTEPSSRMLLVGTDFREVIYFMIREVMKLSDPEMRPTFNRGSMTLKWSNESLALCCSVDNMDYRIRGFHGNFCWAHRVADWRSSHALNDYYFNLIRMALRHSKNPVLICTE